jgi:hypothetical protein
MPPAKRTVPILRTPGPVVVHSAPLVLPISADPLRDGAVAVRGDRVLQVGARAGVLDSFPAARERRWPGMIVAGLVDARSAAVPPGPGVTARASVVTDPAEHAGLPGVSYVEVSCASEDDWEEHGRDAVITAIGEVDRPWAVGVAALTPDPLVLEDIAVLARTFGLRLLVDLDRHSTAALDEAGILGPHCHAVCARPLDPGERKLLRLRKTVVALCPLSRPEDSLALFEEGNRIAFCTAALTPDANGPGDGLLGLARAVREHARARGPRPRGLDGTLVGAVTLGGARALGMSRGMGRIGTLGAGGRADFAVYDARGRYPYAALLGAPPCLATVVGGTVVGGTVVDHLVDDTASPGD